MLMPDYFSCEDVTPMNCFVLSSASVAGRGTAGLELTTHEQSRILPSCPPLPCWRCQRLRIYPFPRSGSALHYI